MQNAITSKKDIWWNNWSLKVHSKTSLEAWGGNSYNINIIRKKNMRRRRRCRHHIKSLLIAILIVSLYHTVPPPLECASQLHSFFILFNVISEPHHLWANKPSLLGRQACQWRQVDIDGRIGVNSIVRWWRRRCRGPCGISWVFDAWRWFPSWHFYRPNNLTTNNVVDRVEVPLNGFEVGI